ncbi:MAG: hypothetical protein CV082_08175 [Candidatus Brocadia sp. BL1]|nr:MAG: hypothetical protein CV082_08175 [Candidatus Brocadia sp. BL1]
MIPDKDVRERQKLYIQISNRTMLFQIPFAQIKKITANVLITYLNENTYFCHFVRREKSSNPMISILKRFLTPFEMTFLVVFIQTLLKLPLAATS